MTDRELLEAAARAAGLSCTVWSEFEQAFWQPDEFDEGCGEWWNPLMDVGNAASLLLKLKMRVDYVGDQPCVEGVLCSGMTAEESFCRAVVRAAASIGADGALGGEGER